jgi:hypothetical protein
MKKVAIIQSNYIPWKGYFDMIRNVDLFIFYDHVQYTKKDWRSRNYIKAPEGLRLLTIPCGHDTNRKISEVEMLNSKWQTSHWHSILQCYKNAPAFRKFKPFFEDIYLSKQWVNLSDFNQYVIKQISTEILGAKTIFEDSRKYDIQQTKANGVKEILEKCGSEIYLCGPAAKDYLTEDFIKTSIKSEFLWMDYSGYPEYNQLYEPFAHNVSIIDLIFNHGYDSVNYMKDFNLEDLI